MSVLVIVVNRVDSAILDSRHWGRIMAAQQAVELEREKFFFSNRSTTKY